MVLRCAIVGLTGIGTRHALGLLGDERTTKAPPTEHCAHWPPALVTQST